MGPDGSGGRCTRGGETACAAEWKPVTYVATGAARVGGGRLHWQRKKESERGGGGIGGGGGGRNTKKTEFFFSKMG